MKLFSGNQSGWCLNPREDEERKDVREGNLPETGGLFTGEGVRKEAGRTMSSGSSTGRSNDSASASSSSSLMLMKFCFCLVDR